MSECTPPKKAISYDMSIGEIIEIVQDKKLADEQLSEKGETDAN